MLALVCALHVLFGLMLWSAMLSGPQPHTVAPADRDQVLVVRLLDDSGTPHIAPPPAPPARIPLRQTAPPHVRPAPHEQPRRDAMVLQDHPASPAPAASAATPAAGNVFAKDGSIRLPPAAMVYSATTGATAKPAAPADDRRIMQHDSYHVHYKATRFEKYFPPPNETAGGAVGRHIGDAIHAIAKSVCDPAKRSTATNLLCGVPPPPPSPKEGDERLNLPPPPLAGDTQPVKQPPLSTCIAEYNDTKPLSYGCPTNTPDLAFKAELRVCIDLYRAGKRLKTWCPADTASRAAAESPAPAAPSSAGSH